MTPKPNTKEGYALRAQAVFHLRTCNWKIRDLCAVFKTTPEVIRQLAARGNRLRRPLAWRFGP